MRHEPCEARALWQLVPPVLSSSPRRPYRALRAAGASTPRPVPLIGPLTRPHESFLMCALLAPSEPAWTSVVAEILVIEKAVQCPFVERHRLVARQGMEALVLLRR